MYNDFNKFRKLKLYMGKLRGRNISTTYNFIYNSRAWRRGGGRWDPDAGRSQHPPPPLKSGAERWICCQKWDPSVFLFRLVRPSILKSGQRPDFATPV